MTLRFVTLLFFLFQCCGSHKLLLTKHGSRYRFCDIKVCDSALLSLQVVGTDCDFVPFTIKKKRKKVHTVAHLNAGAILVVTL